MIKLFLKYKHVTLSLLLFLVVMGVSSLQIMPRREDPKLTIRNGLVVVLYPGANSSQVEEQVTKKLEQYLFEFKEIDKTSTTSITKDGMVAVNVNLTENINVPDVFWNKLWQQLSIAKQLDFPQGVIGPIVNTDWVATETMIIGIESNGAGLSELKEYTQKLEEHLRTIKAVAKIKQIGDQKEQIIVSANAQKAMQYGIGAQQVVKILQSQNAINPTGSIKSITNETPLHTTGHYNAEHEIANQIVGISPTTGAVVKLGDVAKLHRTYAEPSSIITVNDNKAMILAVQMQEGNNVVEFGEDVKEKIAEAQKLFPKSINISTIFSQPDIVDENVSHFKHEFYIAMLAVLLAVILLLPLRISAIIAIIIPITMSATFAIMHLFGIELHQVSLAALILLLGMIVDDAIIIVNNFVELLDEGIDRWTAAKRSANDLAIPMGIATIVVVASFLPMIVLKGPMGEFIGGLPATIAIALISSFCVAMIFTPLLCYSFIKQGTHTHHDESVGGAAQKQKTKKQTSVLHKMEHAYGKLSKWCVAHPAFILLIGLLSYAISVFMYNTALKQKFFPAAEGRIQLLIDLWMPTSTKLEKTNEEISKVEALIKKDKRVVSYATFVGTSMPRFYYNYFPEIPSSNFAQIFVTTTDEKAAESFSEELNHEIDHVVPEGRLLVRQMQQGPPSLAPIEVRIVGEDIEKLKQTGEQVADIIKKTKGSKLVRNDFGEDYYDYTIKLNGEANRLGFTTSSISQAIYAGFTGVPISTIYEGNTPIDIVLRLKEGNRQNTTDDLQNTYIESPITGAKVPLHQIAEIKPQWQTGRIIHRNGVRTLTVLSETQQGTRPSELFESIQPTINQLQLPTGYKIEYGGEYENRNDTFSRLIKATFISFILIFFILVFLFRNLKETIIVMLTVPLSSFGSIMGLWMTGNDFGFSAFIGLIVLSGIVLRNSIIIVTNTKQFIQQGMDIRIAVTEPGKRHLRPIFLATMAAAIGVLPMIISRSPLWAPLASVIAIGVIWSMLMTLLVVPVLYHAWIKNPLQ